MARRIVSVTTISPTPTADATNLVDATYPFILQGGNATQLNRIHEISLSGQSSASSGPMYMLLARDSTIAVTNSAGAGQTDAPLDTATIALTNPVLTGNTNTTKPQRSATLHLLNCSLNTYGGSFFWRANKIDECPAVIGASINTGEVSLSAFTGGTSSPMGAHMIYESL